MTSTVISEVVLASVCFYAALMLWRFSPLQDRAWGALAALITAVAATLGAFKYGSNLPVADAHALAAQAARFVALPLMALAWLFAAWGWPRYSGGRWFAVILVVAAFVCHRWLTAIPYYAEWVLPLSLLLIVAAALSTTLRHREYSLLGVSGAGQIALAGVVIGTSGSINGFPSVDVFHYVLASAWLCMAVGLRHVD